MLVRLRKRTFEAKNPFYLLLSRFIFVSFLSFIFNFLSSPVGLRLDRPLVADANVEANILLTSSTDKTRERVFETSI